MDSSRMEEALKDILNVLGEGYCEIVEKACPGCDYEMREARELAKWGLGLDYHPIEKTYVLHSKTGVVEDPREYFEGTAKYLGLTEEEIPAFVEAGMKLLPERLRQ